MGSRKGGMIPFHGWLSGTSFMFKLTREEVLRISQFVISSDPQIGFHLKERHSPYMARGRKRYPN